MLELLFIMQYKRSLLRVGMVPPAARASHRIVGMWDHARKPVSRVVQKVRTVSLGFLVLASFSCICLFIAVSIACLTSSTSNIGLVFPPVDC
jgi:hypothetical protein